MTPRACARKLAAFAKRTRRLTELTGRSVALRCIRPVSCLSKEQRRQLRGRLRLQGGFALDRLCPGCCAHWHLTMASVELDALEGAVAEHARLVEMSRERRRRSKV